MPNMAINGLGRIGRAALKILLDTDGLDLIAVNDIADVDNLAYPPQIRHRLRALPTCGHRRGRGANGRRSADRGVRRT